MKIDFLYGETYTTINSNYVTKLSQEASSFIGESFYLGSTVCRAFTLSVDKKAIQTLPNDSVKIYDDEENIYADLVIDSIDDSDTKVYTFKLTDRMVRLNEKSNAWFTSGQTIQQLLTSIKTRYGLAGVDTITQYGSMVITWYNNWTARDFVGWVAELLGGYAYISRDGNLKFAKYTNTTAHAVNVSDCDSFKLGSQITIDRVVYDTPNKTVSYPINYSGTGSTLYLNANNELLTDSGGVTIESQVEYIYNQVNGLSFYNVKVGKCPINQDVIAGDCLGFVLGDATYNTIAQVKWDYNTKWFGGYELKLDNAKQQETEIVNPVVKMGNVINQKIDRENGVISSSISRLQEQTNGNSNEIVELHNEITRTADGLALDFNTTTQAMQLDIQQLISDTAQNATDINGFKDIILQTPAGITIMNPGSTVRGQFGSQELAFIDKSSGTDITQAWVGKNGLGGREVNVGDPNTQANQWRIFASADGKHLHFTRHN